MWGGCLLRCPLSRGGSALTGGLPSFTGDVFCLISAVSSLVSSDEAPPPWGFALPDPARVLEVVASGLALEAADALSLLEVVAHLSPSLRPVARPLHTLVRGAAVPASLFASWAPTTGGASPTASRLAQYGFRRASFCTDTCPERSIL